MVDESSFIQLKEPRHHHHNEITAVVFDYDKRLEIGLIAIDSAVCGFDIVWDKIMSSSLRKYFQ